MVKKNKANKVKKIKASLKQRVAAKKNTVSTQSYLKAQAARRRINSSLKR